MSDTGDFDVPQIDIHGGDILNDLPGDFADDIARFSGEQSRLEIVKLLVTVIMALVVLGLVVVGLVSLIASITKGNGKS